VKKEEKEKIVADLHHRLTKVKAVFVTDFRGLNVGSLNTLRQKLRQDGDEYQVVKNTLFYRASQDMPISALKDPVASAKILADFAKGRESFILKGGVLEGRPLSGEAIKQLSRMPAREVLLGQVLSSLIAVPTSLVSTLSGVIQKFVMTLKAIEEQKAQA
jgi:large subunit ribosomal protein L10